VTVVTLPAAEAELAPSAHAAAHASTGAAPMLNNSGRLG
jgi:hypothetical protein